MVLAPFTFRIPNSFVLCSAIRVERLKIPRYEIKFEMKVNKVMIVCDFTWSSAIPQYASMTRILDPSLNSVSDQKPSEKSKGQPHIRK